MFLWGWTMLVKHSNGWRVDLKAPRRVLHNNATSWPKFSAKYDQMDDLSPHELLHSCQWHLPTGQIVLAFSPNGRKICIKRDLHHKGTPSVGYPKREPLGKRTDFHEFGPTQVELNCKLPRASATLRQSPSALNVWRFPTTKSWSLQAEIAGWQSVWLAGLLWACDMGFANAFLVETGQWMSELHLFGLFFFNSKSSSLEKHTQRKEKTLKNNTQKAKSAWLLEPYRASIERLLHKSAARPREMLAVCFLGD